MHAVTSILADVHGKRVTGRGARLDVAMFDAAIAMLTRAFPAYFLTGRSPPGIGNRHSMAAPWNTYRCANGWTVICAGNRADVAAAAAGDRAVKPGRRPALCDAAGPRRERRMRSTPKSRRGRAERSVAEVERLLDENAIPSGPILPLADVVAHPQFQTRRLLVEDRGTPIAGGVFHRDREALEVRAGLHALGAGIAARCSRTRRRGTGALRALGSRWRDRRRRRDDMSLPLEGIRVLDLGISTAGPYASRFLADLGAEVLKIEPIEGENARSLGLRYGDAGYLFHVNNYNKSSVVLRVQSPRGRQLFLELVQRSDVVIENFASGTMDRWGIGYDACREANPSIVYCCRQGVRRERRAARQACVRHRRPGFDGTHGRDRRARRCTIEGRSFGVRPDDCRGERDGLHERDRDARSRRERVPRYGAVRHGRRRFDLALAAGAPRQLRNRCAASAIAIPIMRPSTTTRVRGAASW